MLLAAAENSLNAARVYQMNCKAERDAEGDCNDRDRSLSPMGLPFTGQQPASQRSRRTSEAFGILFSSIRSLMLRCHLPARQVPLPPDAIHLLLSTSTRSAVAAAACEWVTIMPDALFAFISDRMQLEYILRRVRVEVAGRLVGENQFRTVHQCTGDGDALQLATRELARKMISPAAQPDILQHLSSSFHDVFRGHSFSSKGSAIFWRSVRCGKMWNAWKTNPNSLRRSRVAASSLNDEMAVPRDQYLPGIRNIQTSNQIQQGRFANAGFPHDSDILAGSQGIGEIGKHLPSVGVGFIDMAQFQHKFRWLACRTGRSQFHKRVG